MQVMVYKRHAASCAYRGDKNHKRCRCAVWLEWNVNGKQTRKSAKTRSWELGLKKARSLEIQAEDAELGKAAKPGAAKTVAEAIALFTDSKNGEDLAASTLYKHKLTLSRLQAFCEGEGLYFIKDVTLHHLTTWRAHWTFESPLAKRNNQERVKSFFKFCYEAGLITANPAGQLSSIQVKTDEATRVRPFEPKEYKAILAAVPKSGLQPQNAARVKD
jgi:hypothetical protein